MKFFSFIITPAKCIIFGSLLYFGIVFGLLDGALYVVAADDTVLSTDTPNGSQAEYAPIGVSWGPMGEQGQFRETENYISVRGFVWESKLYIHKDDVVLLFGSGLTVNGPSFEPTMESTSKGRCPQCVNENKRSSVYPGLQMVTAMAGIAYYDEDGGFHYDDPNIYTTEYKCSNGHEWSESGKVSE